MSARRIDVGEVSWDILAIRLRQQRDKARADARYWQDRYEKLAGEHGAGVDASDWPGCRD